MKLQLPLVVMVPFLMTGLPCPAETSRSGQFLQPEIRIHPGIEHQGLSGRKSVRVEDGATTVELEAHRFAISIWTPSGFGTSETAHLRIEGSDEPFILVNSQIPLLYFNPLSGKNKSHYVLVLDAGLRDRSGAALESERRVGIFLREPRRPTYAHFDLVGEDGIDEDVGYIEGDPDASARALTGAAKEFVVRFDRPVRKESVEAQIEEGLKGYAGERSLEWVDARKLKLKLGEQARGEGDETVGGGHHVIDASGALDAEGHEIFGAASFSVDLGPAAISSVDLETGETAMIKEFKDKVFSAKRFPAIGRFILMDDGHRDYALDLRTLNQERLTTWAGEWNVAWLNETRFAQVSHDNLIARELPGDRRATVSNGGMGEFARGLRVSPNGKLIAVANSPEFAVHSMDGTLIYRSTIPVVPVMHEGEPWAVNICWLDNQRLVYDAVDGDPDGASQRHIHQVDLGTRQATVLIPNGQRPAVSPNGGSLIYQSVDADFKTAWRLRRGGEDSPLVLGGDAPCEHFLFVDDTRVLFERGEEIIMLELASGRQKVLARGAIIGLSLDRRHLYVNRFKGDLHYDC